MTAPALATTPAPTITTLPMAHQRAAVEKLRALRVGALFMDMGTGKTLTAIMLAVARWSKISRVVWLCPVSLKRNTRRQILMHTDVPPERVAMFDARTTDANLPDADWHIIGLESIGGSDREALAFNALVDENTMLVVDESSYIKGHRSKRTRRLMLIGQRARYRLVLNGTPISQGIEDLYAQMAFLDERILGYRSWYSFQREHIRWSEKHRGKIEGRVGGDKLTMAMAPYVYQVTKDECLDLPPKLPASSHWVGLSPEQERLYAEAKLRFEADIMAREEEDDVGIAIYRLFGALRAIASGVIPAGFDGQGESLPCPKLPELMRILRISHKTHTVVWCSYQANVEAITAALAESGISAPVYTYYGKTGERQRDDALTAWRKGGGIFVATSATGGHGLDLVEASHAIFYSSGFKYSERLQAEDRMHRIGQTSPVSYTDIWADCGIEERIEEALSRKANGLVMLRRQMRAAMAAGKGDVARFLDAL